MRLVRKHVVIKEISRVYFVYMLDNGQAHPTPLEKDPPVAEKVTSDSEQDEAVHAPQEPEGLRGKFFVYRLLRHQILEMLV